MMAAMGEFPVALWHLAFIVFVNLALLALVYDVGDILGFLLDFCLKYIFSGYLFHRFGPHNLEAVLCF